MKKIKAIVKDLKEILEMEKVVKYEKNIIVLEGLINWNFAMNEYIGKEIQIDNMSCEGYYIHDWCYLKTEWLKDIKEEVDWENVPVDTKVLVRRSKLDGWTRRYFQKYKPNEKTPFYTFYDGRTSWSGQFEEGWKHCKLAEDE